MLTYPGTRRSLLCVHNICEVTTQTQDSLGTIATLLELRGQFHVKVETLEAGRTREHGCRLQKA